MKQIRDCLCDIISTIIPEEEEVSCYEQKTDNLKIAKILLDLLFSNNIFKMFAACCSCSKTECQDCSNRVFKQLEQLCAETPLHQEWKEFSLFHLHYMLDNMVDLNPSVQVYVDWELKNYKNTQLQIIELEEQGDNEELIIEYLYTVTMDTERIRQEENSIRLLFESILLLNTNILKDERFQEIIEKNSDQLKRVLSMS